MRALQSVLVLCLSILMVREDPLIITLYVSSNVPLACCPAFWQRRLATRPFVADESAPRCWRHRAGMQHFTASAAQQDASAGRKALVIYSPTRTSTRWPHRAPTQSLLIPLQTRRGRPCPRRRWPTQRRCRLQPRRDRSRLRRRQHMHAGRRGARSRIHSTWSRRPYTSGRRTRWW